MFYLDASYQSAATTHSIIVMTTPSLYRFASVAVVIAIWILSFLPGSAMPQVPGGDKWHHALAYFACMFFWGQWLQVPAQRLKLAGVFILMTIDTQEFPVAAVFRIVFVIAVLVMNGQLAQARGRELAGAAYTEPGQ